MDTDRHARIKKLFLEICGLPREEHHAALDKACGGDRELRRELESLLAFHEDSSVSPTQGMLPDLSAPYPETLPDRIGPYRVLRKLGQGGMGVVYEVRQDKPIRRRLALKLVKWGMDTEEVLVRFESERQALALMNHPNIANVFEAGATEKGRPYFTMEYVDGEPITTYCDKNCLSTEERLDLFLQVCNAVQHAHRKGVIHRDIKSSNVLVRIREGKPSPTIIDFGVAKATQQRLTERTLFTEYGMLIGTPEYMSPEQAEMTGLDVDTRTDVYSLGVVLYELLVGALPFDTLNLRQAGFDELRRRIREEAPSKPSTRVSTLGDASTEAARRRRSDPLSLRRELSGDMDWITMKALEKDRTRRYESPAQLAEDIARHLRHEPVLASPPGAGYRLRKYVRRHRLGVAAGIMVALALFAGLALAAVGLLRAKRAERVAIQEAATANKVSDLLIGLFDDLNRGVPGYVTTVEQLLDRGVQRIESDLGGEPVIQARLLGYLAGAYASVGRTDRGIELVEKTVALIRSDPQPNQFYLGSSIDLLGDLVAAAGDLERAQQLHQEAHGIWTRTLGPEVGSFSLGRNCQSLGRVLMRKGEFQDARSYLDQAEQILQHFTGSLQIHLAHTLFWQAILDSEGFLDHGAAVSRLERALEIFEREFGQQHGYVLNTRIWLGRVHSQSGDVDTAREYFRSVLNLQDLTPAQESHSVGLALTGLGTLLAGEGRLEPAREQLEHALVILGRSGGLAAQDKEWCARSLAAVYISTGEIQNARQLLESSVEELESSVGKEHPVLTRTLHQLGYLEFQAGNPELAEGRYRQALDIQGRVWSSRHYVNTWALYQLGCIAAREGKKEEAIELLQAALDCGYDRETLLEDTDLLSLRGDPRFEKIVAEVRTRRKGLH